jgi:hypothetical protein
MTTPTLPAYGRVPLRPDEYVEAVSIPATAIKVSGTSPPDWGQLQDDGAGSTGVYTYLFDATLVEEIFLAFNYPFGRVPKSPVKAFLEWCATTGNAGDVVWGAERTFTIPDTVMPITVTDESAVTVNGALVPVSSSLTPDPVRAGLLTPESTIFVRLYRLATDAGDTYPDDAALLSLRIAYLATTGRKADNGIDLE